MKASYIYYKFIRGILRLCFPHAENVYEETPGDEPAVFVCNHSAIRGPVMMTLDFKRKHQTWTVSCALDSKEAANYAYHDILFGRTRKPEWFWRMISRIIAKMLPPLLIYSDTIPVYHDKNIIKTFKQSVKALMEGNDLVNRPPVLPQVEESDQILSRLPREEERGHLHRQAHRLRSRAAARRTAPDHRRIPARQHRPPRQGAPAAQARAVHGRTLVHQIRRV